VRVGNVAAGCGKTVCSRRSNWAPLRGPSTSPLDALMADSVVPPGERFDELPYEVHTDRELDELAPRRWRCGRA
jgi:hypothetical protein